MTIIKIKLFKIFDEPLLPAWWAGLIKKKNESKEKGNWTDTVRIWFSEILRTEPMILNLERFAPNRIETLNLCESWTGEFLLYERINASRSIYPFLKASTTVSRFHTYSFILWDPKHGYLSQLSPDSLFCY